jgi:hypothetical protein
VSGARLLSLLVVGLIIAWSIGRAVEAGDGGLLTGAPWYALILIVAIGYAFAFDRWERGRKK